MTHTSTPILTKKERQVLARTDGRSIKEIADELGWPERTVKYYSDTLRKKLGVDARRHLIPLRDRYL